MPSLSKTDYKIACSCTKKLIYKKAGYPTANDTNEYMEMLAEGGFIVEKMGQLLFPEGVRITGTTKEAVELTKKHLEKSNCTLFEAAIQWGNKLVRIDVLRKTGNIIELIEIKAKSHDSDETEKPDKKKLNEYIEDVAYQYLVFSEGYAGFDVRAFLLMPDKAKRTGIEGLAGWFSIVQPQNPSHTDIEELPAQSQPRYGRPHVQFKYARHERNEEFIAELNKHRILEFLDVTKEVSDIQAEVRRKAEIFIRILEKGITASDYRITKGCKSCEFNTGDSMPNGYKECHKELADVDPHIFDLYFGGSIGHYKKGWYLDELLEQGKTSLYDIDIERLKNAKGEWGARGERQLLQIEYTRADKEWISPALVGEIKTFRYPLQFIDFETYTGAVPFHKGMRPYELIAFQWSAHVIEKPGAAPVHHEWIHVGGDFPNFEFASSLRKVVGNTGTPFMWAPHENTVLRTILRQMEIFGHSDAELKDWLTRMTTDKDAGREGRLVDMNKLALQYYFHPHMKGRTSIKKVLPTVWNHHDYLHAIPHFAAYVVTDFEKGVIDPYETLPVAGDTDDEVVKGGTEAMRAYYRIRFDDSLNEEQRAELKRQLLQYCRLDTLAMVIIGYHWGMK